MKMYLPPRWEKPSSRRRFLKRGLLGGVLLAAGGASWLALKKSADTPAPTGLKVFTPRHHAVLTALAARMIPTRAGWPSTETLEVARQCDAIVALADETAQAELKQLLMLFENALTGFLFGRRTLPFTRLDPEEQDAVLHEWATSAVTLRRSGYLALRTIITGAYFSQRASWAPMGYPGPLPKIHDPNAPVWKGGGEPRPLGNGTIVEPEESPP